jgi:HK97 family phage portal protein
MPGKLQRWFNDNIWEVSKRNWYDAIMDVNAGIINSFYATDNFTSEVVTPRTALKNPTIYSAVNVRGNTIASVPCNVIQEGKDNKKILTDHHAYYLLAHEPNSYMTAANFWKTIMLHIDIWGNGYAFIQRDSRQNPVGLHIWEPWEVTTTFEDGEVYYTYNGDTIPSRNMLHYRFYSWDGVCGRSPVMENANTIGMALKLDRYSAILMGIQPPGILSTDKSLTPEQKSQNKNAWQAAGAGQVRVLDGGFKYQQLMSTADESAFAISKRQNKTDLLGIWQMPPQFVQDLERSTFSNAEQMDLVYTKHTVTPICRNLELENNMKLFFEKEKANTYTKFNLNGLLRGDIASRQAFYQSMVNTGVMTRNEARSYEDLNPYEGGEVPLIQGAMTPGDTEGLEALRKKMETEVIPSAPITTKLNGHHVN